MAIGWSETAPSDSSAANLADDELRSLKSNLAGGLANAMYWPGTGGGSLASAGQPLPGAWRAFAGVESLVSAYADGAMYITSDTSRLFGIGSSGTMLLGSARVIEHMSWPGTKARWVESAGTISVGSPITYGIVYDGLPTVTISAQSSAATVLIPILTSVTTRTANINVLDRTGASTSACLVNWKSLGTVTF